MTSLVRRLGAGRVWPPPSSADVAVPAGLCPVVESENGQGARRDCRADTSPAAGARRSRSRRTHMRSCGRHGRPCSSIYDAGPSGWFDTPCAALCDLVEPPRMGKGLGRDCILWRHSEDLPSEKGSKSGARRSDRVVARTRAAHAVVLRGDVVGLRPCSTRVGRVPESHRHKEVKNIRINHEPYAIVRIASTDKFAHFG